MSQHRPKALIVISSNKLLPLSSPEGHPGLPTGFFLCELGQVLKEFDGKYDFTFATPDGELPQLDINGLALPWHDPEHMASASAKAAAAQALRFDAAAYRASRSDLVARREEELSLAYQYLGNIPVSSPMPNTDKEAALIRDDVAAKFASLPTHVFLSARELVEKHRAADDPFDLGEFDFAHLPGGHAPMVDFVDNPWLGELINTLHEEGVLISLICHGPVAMASAKYRVSSDGQVRTVTEHPFVGIRVTTVPKYGEVMFSKVGFLKIPGEQTRTTYYVDEALEQAGYKVETVAPNPGAIKVIWEPEVRVLTGNGPQAVDQQVAVLREQLGAGSGI
jgi:putative intracellular protease/amidase